MRITESRLRRIIRQVILESSGDQIGSKEEEVIDDVISDYFSGNMVKTESDSGNISPGGKELGEEVLKQAKEKPNYAKAISQEFVDTRDLLYLTSIIASDLGVSGGFMFNESTAVGTLAAAILVKFYNAWERTR